MKPKNLLRPVLLTLLVLLVPWVGMRFTDEVRWTSFDFLALGVLIFGVSLFYEWTAQRSPNWTYRGGVGAALATLVLLLWINGAVGVIGSENHPANLLYGAVVATLVSGSMLARFRAAGMARALWATALVQAMVPVVALILWSPRDGGAGLAWTPGVFQIFVLNAAFAGLWIVSGLFFSKAGRE